MLGRAGSTATEPQPADRRIVIVTSARHRPECGRSRGRGAECEQRAVAVASVEGRGRRRGGCKRSWPADPRKKLWASVMIAAATSVFATSPTPPQPSLAVASSPALFTQTVASASRALFAGLVSFHLSLFFSSRLVSSLHARHGPRTDHRAPGSAHDPAIRGSGCAVCLCRGVGRAVSVDVGELTPVSARAVDERLDTDQSCLRCGTH